MLPTANEPQGEEEENSKESEDMDDDEEEIENILLGYTKAPALEPGKKILKSEAVRSNAPPVSAVVPVVEIPISEFLRGAICLIQLLINDFLHYRRKRVTGYSTTTSTAGCESYKCNIRHQSCNLAYFTTETYQITCPSSFHSYSQREQ